MHKQSGQYVGVVGTDALDISETKAKATFLGETRPAMGPTSLAARVRNPSDGVRATAVPARPYMRRFLAYAELRAGARGRRVVPEYELRAWPSKRCREVVKDH